MIRVLFISPVLPYSQVPHAGGDTIYNLVTRLTMHCQVSLISSVRPEEKQWVEELRPYCHILETVPAYKTFWERVMCAPMLLAHPQPVVEGASPEMDAKIKQVLSKAKFDVVQIEYSEMARFVRFFNGCSTILDEHDIFSIPACRKYQLTSHGLTKLWWWFEWKKRQRQEDVLRQRFDCIFVRAPHDKEAILVASPNTNVAVLPHGCPDELFDIPLRPGSGKRILFVGAMHRVEKQEAVLFFYNVVFPLIRRRLPDVHLDIVGSSPPERIRSLARDSGVTVTGFVPSLRPYYEQCSVCIAPTRVPGGIMAKIVNAMGAGRPVVSTSLGNEGIAATPEEEICVADTPEQFAEQTVRLLSDSEFWQKIAYRGREIARERYSWQAIIDHVLGVYERLSGRS